MVAYNKGEDNELGIGIIAKQCDGCLNKIFPKGRVIPARLIDYVTDNASLLALPGH